MMDIVFLIDGLTRGGAETQFVRIATTMKSRGWKVGILTMLPENAFSAITERLDVPVVHCEDHVPLVPALMTYRIVRQLRIWRPAVLVTFNYHADIMGRVCGKIAGVRVIISSLRTAYIKARRREIIYRLTEPLINLTISNSQAALTLFANRGILTPRKTMVVPNGIIKEEFLAAGEGAREAVRKELGIASGAFFWLAVGTLRPAKDYPNLLRAAAHCASVTRDFRLAIVGSGELEEYLIRETMALGLTDLVQFLGARADVANLMNGCDAYVLSSAWEGLPNTIMEAMASAVPVVATDVGGVRELVVQDVTGFYMKPGNPVALGDQMLAMMAMDREDLRLMGERGRQRVLARFDNERVVDQWESKIREITAPAGPVASKPNPSFTVSLDFELLWGMRDKRTVKTYGDHILGERQAIPAILRMFKEFGIRATWAAVGLTLFDNRKEMVDYLPTIIPTYARPNLNPYAALNDIGDNEKSDPYHYGLSLIRQILAFDGMELGSHTFSHYYCLEEGQIAPQFQADLEASVHATKRLAERPVSLVFPRNQYNSEYLSVCSSEGFKVFRGNETAWMYRESMEEDQSLIRRGARLMDNYMNITGHNGFLPSHQEQLVNCPSSRFLRPYSRGRGSMEGLRLRRICHAMESAAREGFNFHLWWHPHNFGADLRRNLQCLERILRFHTQLREKYGVTSMTMSEVAQAILN